MIDNDFPSTAELLSRPEKWAALFYEPYRYFQNVIDGEWMYYIKTAALAEEINQYYGWNFYSTITEPAIVPPEIEERYYDNPADTAA